MAGEIKIQVQIQAEIQDLGKIIPIITTGTTENGIETKVCILHVDLVRPIEPKDVSKIISALNMLKKWIEGEVLVLSGRGPIWMYISMAHVFHGIAPAVAVLDPKLKGAVVVMSHTPKVREFTIVQIPQEILDNLTQLKTTG